MAKRIIDSYSDSNINSVYNLSSTIKKVGQALTISYPCVIDSITFYVGIASGNPGDSFVEVYACSGTPGVNGVGTGSPLATSVSVAEGSIPGAGPIAVNYVFSGVNQLALPAGNYVFMVSSTVADASNIFDVYADSSAPTHPGNTVEYRSGPIWTSRSTIDTPFILYGYKTPFSPFPSAQNIT